MWWGIYGYMENNTKAADRTLNAGRSSWRDRKVGEEEILALPVGRLSGGLLYSYQMENGVANFHTIIGGRVLYTTIYPQGQE